MLHQCSCSPVQSTLPYLPNLEATRQISYIKQLLIHCWIYTDTPQGVYLSMDQATNRSKSTSRRLPLDGSGNEQIRIHLKAFTSRWIRQRTDPNPPQGVYLSMDQATNRSKSTSRRLPLDGSGNEQIQIHLKAFTSRWIRRRTDPNPPQGVYLSMDQATNRSKPPEGVYLSMDQATNRSKSTSRRLPLDGSGNEQIQTTSRCLPLDGSGNEQIQIHLKAFTSRWIRQHIYANPLPDIYLDNIELFLLTFQHTAPAFSATNPDGGGKR